MSLGKEDGDGDGQAARVGNGSCSWRPARFGRWATHSTGRCTGCWMSTASTSSRSKRGKSWEWGDCGRSEYGFGGALLVLLSEEGCGLLACEGGEVWDGFGPWDGEAVTEVVPEGDVVALAGLDEGEEGVAAVAAGR